MRKVSAAAIIALTALAPSIAAADANDYPNRAIRIIIGFAPGTTTDILTRVVGDELSKRLGQPVVVENMPGAASVISANAAAAATPDGYSLYVAPVGLVINPMLYPDVQYDPVEDFAPITLMVRTGNVLVANNDLPVENVADLIELAKASPGKLKYATSGKGSSSYLNMELLKAAAGIDMVEVPYKISSQALTDTIGGQIALNFPSLAAVLPQIRAGNLRALGISSAERSSAAPDIPAIGETVEGYEASSWYGMVTQAGTPQAIVDKLHAELTAVLEMPEVRSKLEEQGLDVVASTPEEFATVLQANAEKWSKLVDDLGIGVN